MSQGKVYLVGAGPGDYKLITLKGRDCMEEADVIVYDRLADERLLGLARPDAELVYVGKASSEHTLRQEDINRLLVEKAKEGRIVVRLKGGDPFVFGRGGEEALELAGEGVPFEIVPGVTSAIAVPAYAGIPVTHRGLATSFAVVTGHEEPGKTASGICWDKLASGVDTLVFLMGVENLPAIAAQLMNHGRSPDTPAAVIRWGTKPEQEVLLTTLARAAGEVAGRGLKPPAVFIVGEVVALRKQLAWFDTKPLFGKTILVTRAREQASALSDALEALGARCLEAPVIKIVPPESFDDLDRAVGCLKNYDWLIFTSANGVDYFFRRLHAAGLDSRALGGRKVAAIGVPTAARLRGYGLIADLVPAEFRAEGVVAALQGELKPGMRVLIPRAEVARELLPEKLSELGAEVSVVTAYRTITADTDGPSLAARLAAGEIDLVTFTSSSTVTNLLALLGRDTSWQDKTRVACIGPITAAACLDNGIVPDAVAEDYTIRGLVSAICTLFEEGSK
ncbi:MAG TPA: uroporphyrinogen-III C-methyltransferase [Selenomonadales bacterium]|nr:uroporphyrinogen-III C-methyltransferase [Selenomonadales bacterium]